jgi:hypothetical protein
LERLMARGRGKQKATFAGGWDNCKTLSGFGRRGLGLGFGFGSDRGFFAFDVSLPAFSFDGFVVLLAHSSLHSFGIPILCAIL